MSIFQGAYTMKNFYEELNITFDANEKTILNALHRIAQSGQYSLEQIQQIKETLLNPEKRAEYNLTLTQNQPANFYEILNILPNASKNTILNAIRRKAESGELSLEEIQEIKETLLNSDKRAEYDKNIVPENNSNPQKPKKLKQEQRILIMSLAALLLIFLFGIGFYSYMDYKEKPKEIIPKNLYDETRTYKSSKKDNVKIGSSTIKKGELFFFAKGETLMNALDIVKPLPKEENKPIAIEYISTSKDKRGNLAVLYQRKFYSNRAEIHGRKNREKHIQIVNFNLPNGENDKIKEFSLQYNLLLNGSDQFYNTINDASYIKFLDKGKLFIAKKEETLIIQPRLQVFLDETPYEHIRVKLQKEIEAIPMGKAIFINEKYIAFNKQKTNNGSIVFYDMENKELSNINISYNAEDYKIKDNNYITNLDFFNEIDRKHIFVDKKGEKIGIYLKLANIEKNKAPGVYDREAGISSVLEVYKLEKKGNNIIGTKKILEQYFPNTIIEMPKFSDDGTEIHFIQRPAPKNNKMPQIVIKTKNVEYTSALPQSEKTKNAQFVRWSISKNNEIFAHKIDIHNVRAYHFNNKRNDFFAVGKPDKDTWFMFDKEDKKIINDDRIYVYYHHLKQPHGYIDNLISEDSNQMYDSCEFLFSENEDIFMPICRGFLKTPVYFHTKDMEKPVYLNDILKEKNIVY